MVRSDKFVFGEELKGRSLWGALFLFWCTALWIWCIE
jgi:hypothetical protein